MLAYFVIRGAQFAPTLSLILLLASLLPIHFLLKRLKSGWATKMRLVFSTILYSFICSVVIGLLVSGYFDHDPLPSVVTSFSLLLAAFTIAAGAGAVSALSFVRLAQNSLPDNQYGICTGLAPPGRFKIPGVTDWLHEKIQTLAGRTASERPLTFGDLAFPREYKPETTDGSVGSTTGRLLDIGLALMTTNATLGTSHSFPFPEDWRTQQLYFKKDELRMLFPEPVVRWMCEKAGQPQPVWTKADADQPGHVAVEDGTYRLPPMFHLPVVFGAQISMSFPFLLSAIPLYTSDLTAGTENVDSKRREYKLRRCWFSDGGVTSNFPLRFFDTPLPRRPTFAINLMRAGAIKGDDRSVWLPGSNDPLEPFKYLRFNVFDERGEKLSGFFSALFDTSRDWADTEQIFMPGYLERIVHVELSEEEGGLNLDMPPSIIEAIGNKGAEAGKLLIERFLPNEAERRPDEERDDGWDNHRWIRYRSYMCCLEDIITDFARRWKKDAEEQPAGSLVKSYETLLNDSSTRNEREFGWLTNEQYEFAKAFQGRFAEARRYDRSTRQDSTPLMSTGSRCTRRRRAARQLRSQAYALFRQAVSSRCNAACEATC
jgi:hypothetical protein